MLLPATKLHAVQEKLGKGRRAELGELEKAFLRASERRQTRVHRTRRTVMAVLAVLLVLAAGFAVTAKRSSALASRQQALAQSRQLAADAAVLQASNPEISLLLSLEAYRVQPSYEAISSLLSAQGGLFAARLADPVGPVHGVAYAPGGSLIAAAGDGDAVTLWDAASHRLVGTLPGRSPFYAVAFDRTGTLLAGAEQDGTTVLWNVLTRRQVGVLGTPDGLPVDAVAFDPARSAVATAGYDGTVTLWDTRTLRKITALGLDATVHGIAFSPDGTAIAAACSDHDVRIWKLAGPAVPLVLAGHTGPVQAVAFGPGSSLLASGGDDGTIRLWDARTGKARGFLSGSALPVDALAFSPDGTELASSGGDDAVRLWDVATLTQVGSLTGPADAVAGVAFSPGGHALASADADGTVDLWDIAAPPQPGSKAAAVVVSAPSPGGALATADQGRAIDLWDSPSAVGRPLPAPGGASIPSMAFSPDGRILAVAPPGDQIALWNTRTRREIGTLFAPAPLTSVAYRPRAGAAVVAAGSSDGYVFVWGPVNAPPVQLGGGQQARVNSLAFSPDGTLLAAGSDDGTIALARVTLTGTRVTAAPLQQIGDLLSPVDAVAFSPDGRVLATGSANGAVELWDVSAPSHPQHLATLTGLTQAVISVAFSSSGVGALAVSAADGTIRLWSVADPADPAPLAALTGVGSPTSIAWEPASPTVIGAAPDGTVLSWDTRASQIAARICASPLAGNGPDLGPYLTTGIAYHPICPAG
jgi:WD40 repeat protein